MSQSPPTMSTWRKSVRLGALGADLPSHSERKRLRQSAGLTRRQVAELMRCTEASIRNWETGSDPRNLGRDRMYRRLLHAFRQYEAATALRQPWEDWCIQ